MSEVEGGNAHQFDQGSVGFVHNGELYEFDRNFVKDMLDIIENIDSDLANMGDDSNFSTSDDVYNSVHYMEETIEDAAVNYFGDNEQGLSDEARSLINIFRQELDTEKYNAIEGDGSVNNVQDIIDRAEVVFSAALAADGIEEPSVADPAPVEADGDAPVEADGDAPVDADYPVEDYDEVVEEVPAPSVETIQATAASIAEGVDTLIALINGGGGDAVEALPPPQGATREELGFDAQLVDGANRTVDTQVLVPLLESIDTLSDFVAEAVADPEVSDVIFQSLDAVMDGLETSFNEVAGSLNPNGEGGASVTFEEIGGILGTLSGAINILEGASEPSPQREDALATVAGVISVLNEELATLQEPLA